MVVSERHAVTAVGLNKVHTDDTHVSDE